MIRSPRSPNRGSDPAPPPRAGGVANAVEGPRPGGGPSRFPARARCRPVRRMTAISSPGAAASAADNARGAVFMTAALAAFAVNDTFTKAVSDALPLFEILLWRGVMVSGALIALTLARGTLRLAMGTQDWFWTGVRTAAEIGTAWFFLNALFAMPIANATAILQTVPLTVTLAGALFLGETVGWRRWAAIGAGFAGVLMIARPGPDGFDAHALQAMAAVLCVTLRDIATRRLSSAVPTGTVAVVSAVGVTIYAAAMTAGTPMTPVAPLAAAQVAGAAAFIMAAYILSVSAVRVGDVSFVAPFRYTGILAAIVLGALALGERPDALALAGAAVVAGAGLYTFRRERAAKAPGRAVDTAGAPPV